MVSAEGSARSDPGQVSGDPGAGLVDMHHLGGGQHAAGLLGEAAKLTGRLGRQRRHPAAAAWRSQHRTQQLGGADDRQVLADQQVGPSERIRGP